MAEEEHSRQGKLKEGSDAGAGLVSLSDSETGGQ